MRLAAVVLTVTLAAFASTGCTRVPRGVEPVTGFEVERYLGTWYEIARLDHRFERGLSHVTAEYTLREDGRIDVVNRGYNAEKGEWKEAEGVARFRGDETTGSLSVTFQWPFRGGYHIIALDKEDYRWAMVSGPTRSYLWILARERTLDSAITERLTEQAREAGYPVDDLIWVEQVPPVEEPAGG